VNPFVEDVLGNLSNLLITELAPSAQPAYSSALLTYAGLILSAAAEEVGRSAWRLREDKRALRRLFIDIRSVIEDPVLRAELGSHIDSDDEDIRLSALRQTADAMWRSLTRAHAIVERIDTTAARSIEEAIWKTLREATTRRRVSVELF
jgi:hypothetical protein